MDERDLFVIRVLGALADPSRFQMLKHLYEGERHVSELGQVSNVSQSCATRHLQSLERAGLVRSRRDGKRVSYRLATREPALRELIAWAVHGAPMVGESGSPPEPAGSDSRGAAHGRGVVPGERDQSLEAEGASADWSRAEPYTQTLRPGDLEDYLL